jgi:hypothetical protein
MQLNSVCSHFLNLKHRLSSCSVAGLLAGFILWQGSVSSNLVALTQTGTPPLPRKVSLGPDTETMQLAEFPLSITQEPGIMLPVKWEGKTYTFMLDTGATATTVDESLRPLLGSVVEHNQAEPSVGGNVVIDLYNGIDDATVGPPGLFTVGRLGHTA